MKTVETHGTFEQALAGASDEVKEIAHGLRKLVIEIYPEVVEVPWPK